MKRVTILLFLLLVFYNNILIAQEKWEKILAFPTAAELGNFGRSPVGYFTGTNQVSVPIHEFKTRNLTYPISLNYSTNGFKVDKVSSRVGFDWSINAEGVITRIIRGFPDDANQVTSYPVSLDPLHHATQSQEEFAAELSYYQAWSSGTETEPDLFSFNFNGNSGQFYTDYENNIIMVPYQDLKVERTTPDGYKIIDSRGIKYEFDKGEKSSFNNGGSTVTTSAYYLTKIIHPAGDTILFKYTVDNTISNNNISYKTSISDNITLGVYAGGSPTCPTTFQPGGPNLPLANTSQIWGYYTHISSIEASGYGKIKFFYADDRLDFMEPRLDSIVILNQKDEVIKSISLYQQFLHTTLFNNIGNYTNVGSSRDDVSYRMFLDSISIRDNQGLIEQKYSFEYNDLDELPVRLSYSQDHWGYFNGASNSSLLPDAIPVAVKQSLFQHVASARMSANRNPNYLFSQKGVLSKVKFPTGGFTTYQYEAHSLDGNPVEEVGGVRLKQQASYSNDGILAHKTTYSYSGGYRGLYDIEYYFHKTVHKGCPEDLYPDNYQTFETYELRSNPLFQLSSTGGIEICYQNVTVFNGDSNVNTGKEEYEFDIDDDRFESPVYGSITYPMPYTNSGWRSGTKIREKYYKNDNGSYIPLKEIIYNYVVDTANSVSNYYPSIHNDDFQYIGSYLAYTGIDEHFDVAYYEIISKWRYLSTKIEKSYDEDGQLVLKDSIIYLYENPNHSQITREETITSSGDKSRIEYKYPHDFDNYFSTLIANNIINVPIDVRKYLNNSFVEGKQFRYNSLGNPTEIYQAELNVDSISNPSNPYTFSNYMTLDYDNTNNIKQINKYDNIKISYIWSYNNTLPIAEVKNSSIEKVAFTNFEEFNEGSWNYSTGTIMHNSSARGNNYYNFSGTNAITRSVSPGSYIIEYWAKSAITISGAVITNIYSSAPDAKGWIHFKKKFITASTITLSLSSSSIASIDELRLYPIDAEMTTFSYKPLVGMISKTDTNGLATFYEYDSFNRMEYIKDNDHNILKHIEYHYKSEDSN